jgi:hypothetical protein
MGSALFLVSLFFTVGSFADPLPSSPSPPKFHCPVEGDNGQEREATTVEASRRAGSFWNSARATAEADLGVNWIPTFLKCAKRSGLPLEAFALDRSTYVRKIKVALANARKKLATELDPKVQMEQMDSLEKKFQDILALDSTLREIVEGSAIPSGERDRITKNYSELVEKEKNDCTAVDFSQRLGPIRDQTDKGWCYAFSAADLVTFRLGPDTTNFTRRVSAADLAFQFNQQNISWFEKFFYGQDSGTEEGGWMGESLRASLKKGGFCLEKNAPSENFLFGRLDETIRDIRTILDSRQPSREQFCFTYLRVQDMFPGIDFDSYAKILAGAQGDNYKYFRSLHEKNCEGKRHSYDLSNEDIIDADRRFTPVDAMLGIIDHQLNKQNVLAIGFKTKMISRGASGNHATVVVGRKYDEETKTCRYLLRNSWGTSCGGSLRKELCAPERLGHLWVAKKQLRENLDSLTYIKP